MDHLMIQIELWYSAVPLQRWWNWRKACMRLHIGGAKPWPSRWQVLSSAPLSLGKQLLLGSYSKVEGPGMLTDMLSEVSSIHFGTYYLPVSSLLQEKTWERWTGPASALSYWRTTRSQGLFGSWLESHFKAITHSELYSNTEINAST